MDEILFGHIYTLVYKGVDIHGNDEYDVFTLAGFYPEKKLIDDLDGTNEGTVVGGGDLTVSFGGGFPITHAATLLGTDGSGGWAVDAANGTIYFLSDTDNLEGGTVSLWSAMLDMNCFAEGTLIAGPGGEVELCPKVGDGLKRAAYHGGAITPSISMRKDMPPWPNLLLYHSNFHRNFHLIR